MAVTETRSLPPKFVEDLGKDYATQLTGLTSQRMPVEKYQPMVAGQDQATQRAYNMATTQGQGIGSYAPYMAQAGALQGMGLNYLQGAQAQSGVQGQQLGLQGQQLGAQARQLGAVGQQLGAQRQQLGAVGQQLQAQGAYSGPQAYKQFMSPYQQDVINASLGEFDKQAAKGMSGIGQMAAKSGNLGGGREGVMRSEFKSNSDMNRALLNAKLLQQGFGQAQQARQQDIQNRFGLGQAQAGLGQAQAGLASQQLGLGQFEMGRGQFQTGLAGQVPQLQRADISTLGQVGAAQQAQEQAELDAARQGARTAAYEPLERLGFFGQGVTGLMGGYPAQYNLQSTPPASPLQTALGLGTGLAGIFGALK